VVVDGIAAMAGIGLGLVDERGPHRIRSGSAWPGVEARA